jgi:hypothetical protein
MPCVRGAVVDADAPTLVEIPGSGTSHPPLSTDGLLEVEAGYAGRRHDSVTTESPRRHSRESLLQAVAALAKTAMPGDPEASLFVQTANRRTTVNSTRQLATDLDEVHVLHLGRRSDR